MVCSVALFILGDCVIAKDVTTNLAAQGKTDEEALSNLRETLEAYYSTIPNEDINTYPTMLPTLVIDTLE